MLYVFVFDFNIIVYSQFIQSDIIQVCCSIKNINSEYIIFLPDLIIFASRAVDIPTGDTHIPSDMSIGNTNHRGTHITVTPVDDAILNLHTCDARARYALAI